MLERRPGAAAATPTVGRGTHQRPVRLVPPRRRARPTILVRSSDPPLVHLSSSAAVRGSSAGSRRAATATCCTGTAVGGSRLRSEAHEVPWFS